MTDMSIARFESGVAPERLDQFVPPEFAPVFEPLSYVPWTPQAKQVDGEYTITRSAAVLPSASLTRMLQYGNPLSRLRANVISAASMLKRGRGWLPKSENPCGIVHSIWTAGYYHWLTESLPRALVLKQQFPEAIPTLPSERYRPYVQSLKAIGHLDASFFPNDSNLAVVDPVLTDCTPRFATTAPTALESVRNTILENLEIESRPPRRKVYISRECARGRFVLNEEDVVATLSSHGFEIVHAETLSFREQVELFNSARTLVSIHGAGLANGLFMQPGSNLVELLPKRNGIFDYNRMRNTIRHDACYVRLAAAMRLIYGYLLCETDAKFYEKTHMANVRVDIDSLQDLLRKIAA